MSVGWDADHKNRRSVPWRRPLAVSRLLQSELSLAGQLSRQEGGKSGFGCPLSVRSTSKDSSASMAAVRSFQGCTPIPTSLSPKLNRCPKTMQKFEPTRNLLIVQDQTLEDPADWIVIKQRIVRDAPIFRCASSTTDNPNWAIEPWLAQRPSLIFSASGRADFAPRSGAVFCGHLVAKNEQMRRLASIGIPTPKTAIFSPPAILSTPRCGANM